jgi:hypothetical protein
MILSFILCNILHQFKVPIFFTKHQFKVPIFFTKETLLDFFFKASPKLTFRNVWDTNQPFHAMNMPPTLQYEEQNKMLQRDEHSNVALCRTY